MTELSRLHSLPNCWYDSPFGILAIRASGKGQGVPQPIQLKATPKLTRRIKTAWQLLSNDVGKGFPEPCVVTKLNSLRGDSPSYYVGGTKAKP